MIIRQIDHPTEDIADIRDLDTRESDDDTDTYLHEETEQWRDWNRTLPDGIEVIEKCNTRDDHGEYEDDMESMFENRCKVDDRIQDRNKKENRQDDSDPSTIGNGCTAEFWSVEMGSIEESPFLEHRSDSTEDERREDAGEYEEYDDLEWEGHRVVYSR